MQNLEVLNSDFFPSSTTFDPDPKSINHSYTSSCLDFDNRFTEHRQNGNPTSFISKVSDRQEYLVLSGLTNRHARKIEKHIKRMKSATYITNLKKYPEILEKLKLTYNQ